MLLWISFQTVNALLAKENYNIIVVDWKKGAKGLYLKQAANTWVVGRQAGRLIGF